MNAMPATPPTPQPRLGLALAIPARRAPPFRTFGTGYGRSSGYAAAGGYTRERDLPRFRCA